MVSRKLLTIGPFLAFHDFDVPRPIATSQPGVSLASLLPLGVGLKPCGPLQGLTLPRPSQARVKMDLSSTYA